MRGGFQMSEEAKDAPKKKGKMPIIIVLALLLAGGGFFMMKSKGGAPKKPKIELAEKESELEEFLVNMKGGTTYLRTKLAVKLRKDYTEEKLKDNIGAVEDAVITVLRDTSPDQIRSGDDFAKLKKRLAEAINTKLEGPVVEDKPKAGDKGEAGDDTPKRSGKVTEIEKSAEGEPAVKKKPEMDWDSKSGPVLQIFFKSFATQT